MFVDIEKFFNKVRDQKLATSNYTSVIETIENEEKKLGKAAKLLGANVDELSEVDLKFFRSRTEPQQKLAQKTEEISEACNFLRNQYQTQDTSSFIADDF